MPKHPLARERRKLTLASTPTPEAPSGDRLVPKGEVLERTCLSFPTIWQMMRNGKFPLARIVGGKSMWLASEVDAWIASLPVRKYKGDRSDD